MFVFEFTFRYKQQRTVHVQARLSGQNQKSDGGQKKINLIEPVSFLQSARYKLIPSHITPVPIDSD
jgi:hypothetical protein